MYWLNQGTPSSEALEFKDFQGPLQGLFKALSESTKNTYKMAVAIQPSRRKKLNQLNGNVTEILSSTCEPSNYAIKFSRPN